MLLTREEILSINDLLPTIVCIPGPAGQGNVGVRMLTAGEREDFLDLITEQSGQVKRLKPVLCALTLCDGQGGRLFALQEIDALAAKSEEFIDRVFQTARQINNLTSEAADEGKKNSETLPDAVSSSNSVAHSVDALPETGANV